MASRVTTCTACQTKNRVPTSASGRPQCASCGAPLAWVAEAGDSNLAAALDTSLLVLVDLWAPWCGPCRMVAPVLERLAERYAGSIKVVKVNVDHNPQAAARFDARSIPTLVFLRRGRPVHRVVGAQPEPALASQVERLLAST